MKPRTYIVGGKELELYTIGELARQLDRQRQTVRKWEKDGIIPQARYRSGADRRLYTRNQIEAIVRCVNKYKIKQGQQIPYEFVEEVKQAFEEATQKDLN